MQRIIDGIRMEIPDDATRETLLQELHRPGDSTIYAVTPDGDHRVLNPGEPVASEPGERLGIISRFRTGRDVWLDGMRFPVSDDATRDTLLRFGSLSRFVVASRDTDRVKAEIKLLEDVYGRDTVVWAPDYAWIMLENWKLPPKYNATHVHIIVLVPDQYGYGPSYSDSFVPKGLRLEHDGRRETIPHYFEEFPFVKSGFANELQRQGWSYLSVHPQHWNSSDNVTTFLTQVYTFLSDPFADWDKKA